MKLTWDKLIEMEPKLNELYESAKNEKQTPGYCANRVWFTTLKPKLLALVGWDREEDHNQLCTDEAYDIAYETIYEALPCCDHESPFC